MSDILLSYNKAEALLPQYTLPETFDIGHHNVTMLIEPQQLKGHLSILNAFHSLRKTVESDSVSRLPADVREMEPEQRWDWFVNVAVERFHRWSHGLGEWLSADLELVLPPIDVLMVWHAYLLNPIWYAEDVQRVPALDRLPALTGYLAANIGSPDLLITDSPSPDRVRNWECYTCTPYDPLDAAVAVSGKEIQCPYCEHRMTVPFIGPNGSGYAQGNFVASCTSCGKEIKKDLLGLHRFVSDLVNDGGYLAGTLHTPYNQYDIDRATLIKKNVKAALKIPVTGTVSTHQVMTELEFDPALLTRLLDGRVRRGVQGKILGAYTDDRPFSVELAGAVLRQASFVRKMADLGWTDPDFFADEEEMVVLQHSVARYHGFLGLMTDSPGTFFVPTLDIDLAWHTHQLRATHYHEECKRVVGRYINHDDKVDEGHLSTSFDDTRRAWTDRYRLPYIYCGCPLSGATLGQRLRNALSLHHRRTTNEQDVLQPLLDVAADTHQNAVYTMHNRKTGERARERRRQRVERRRRREVLDAKKMGKKLNGSAALGDRRGDMRLQELAFFYPIPMRIGDSCVTAAGGQVASCTNTKCSGGGNCVSGNCGSGNCGSSCGSSCGGGD